MNIKTTLLIGIILMCLFTFIKASETKKINNAIGERLTSIDTEQLKTNALLTDQIKLLKDTNKRYDSMTQESIDQNTAKKKWGM